MLDGPDALKVLPRFLASIEVTSAVNEPRSRHESARAQVITLCRFTYMPMVIKNYGLCSLDSCLD